MSSFVDSFWLLFLFSQSIVWIYCNCWQIVGAHMRRLGVFFKKWTILFQVSCAIFLVARSFFQFYVCLHTCCLSVLYLLTQFHFDVEWYLHISTHLYTAASPYSLQGEFVAPHLEQLHNSSSFVEVAKHVLCEKRWRKYKLTLLTSHKLLLMKNCAR